jgi:hypothetical protein
MLFVMYSISLSDSFCGDICPVSMWMIIATPMHETIEMDGNPKVGTKNHFHINESTNPEYK